MGKIFQTAWVNVRKMPSAPRLWLVAVFLILFSREAVSGIGEYCVTQNTAISPWIYPFIFTTNYYILLFFFNFILLLADAPFMDETQLFYILRCGRKKWYAGQILYVVIASVLYFSSVFILTLIWLAPYMKWQSGWGKILTTMAIKGTGNNAIDISIGQGIIEKYSPVSAFAISFVLCVLAGIFLGILMFVMNLMFKRGSGLAAASILVMLQFFIYFEISGRFLRLISPISWMNLSYINDTSLGYPIWYPFLGLTGLIMVLSAIGFWKIHSLSFEVQEET